MTTRRSLAILAVVLLIIVGGVAVLYAVRAQEPPTRVFVPPSLTPTPTASAPLATSTSVATPPSKTNQLVANIVACGTLVATPTGSGQGSGPNVYDLLSPTGVSGVSVGAFFWDAGQSALGTYLCARLIPGVPIFRFDSLIRVGDPGYVAPPAGVITGRVLYQAGFIPAVTVYAINVADQERSFFVQRPRFAEGQGPDDRATYSITGVASGTYYVVAWRDSDPTATNQPGLYSQFVVRCVQPSMAGASPLPPECGNSRTGDHSLVPVTVRAGETASRIDVGDWSYDQASYPPRPTPMGFLLPQSCRYVTAPVVAQPGPVTTWEFNCGVTPDLGAIERLSPSFAQQGWTVCRASSGGHGVWAKETTETFVNQSAAGNPTLSQVARSSQDCP